MNQDKDIIRTVWIVKCMHSQYDDDFTTWDVYATASKEQALKIVDELEKLISQIKVRPTYNIISGEYRNPIVQSIHKIDPNYQWGAYYEVQELAVRYA